MFAMRILGQMGLVVFLSTAVTRLAAQVYSVNIVGYSSRTIPLVAPVTAAYISNPLYTIDDRLSTILSGVPEGTVILLHRNGAFETYEYLGGAWDPADAILHPGEGAIIYLDRNAVSNPTVLRVIGEVPQGTLVNPIPPGESLRASIVPRFGRISTDLGLIPREGDELFLFNETTQSEEAYVYIEGVWISALDGNPSEPIVRVGQCFRYLNASGTVNNWTQIFNVNFRASEGPPVTASSTYPLPSASLLCPVGPAGLIVRRTSSQVQVTWPLEFSRYQLQSSTNLATGVWSQVNQTPVTIGERLQVTLPTSGRQSFFRLRSMTGSAPELFTKTCAASALGLYWHRSFTGYRVDQTDSVTSPSWTPVPQTTVDTNGFWQVSVPFQVQLRFFRLAR
jgi:hypothetical protein